MSDCPWQERLGRRTKPQLGYVRVLLAAVLKQAVKDAAGGKNVPDYHQITGMEFVNSEVYVGFCDFFRIRPTARQEVVDRLMKV